MNNVLTKNAQRFRTTLIVTLTFAVMIAAALVIFAVQYSEQYAQDVQQTVYDADNSQTKIDNITNLAQQLSKNQDSVARVEKVVADSKSYAYQDLIIQDLRTMAAKAGVTISSFDFTDGSPVTGGAPAPKKPSGPLHTKTANITLKNPVNYDDFLNFLHYIELNNTKMQISSVAISAVTGGNLSSNINSESLEVEVYVK